MVPHCLYPFFGRWPLLLLLLSIVWHMNITCFDQIHPYILPSNFSHISLFSLPTSCTPPRTQWARSVPHVCRTEQGSPAGDAFLKKPNTLLPPATIAAGRSSGEGGISWATFSIHAGRPWSWFFFLSFFLWAADPSDFGTHNIHAGCS